jgi:hypothetical protein
VPAQPFLFITKEWALPPRLEAQLAGLPQFSRVVIPEAAYLDIADGPLFEPALLPPRGGSTGSTRRSDSRPGRSSAAPWPEGRANRG